MDKEKKSIDKLFVSLFNLYTYHMDLSDEEKKVCKETFIESGRELYDEFKNENKDE